MAKHYTVRRLSFQEFSSSLLFFRPGSYTLVSMLEEHVYSVSELNKEARQLLEGQIGAVWLEGEISNLTKAPSGHLYFTVKDSHSEISAARFTGKDASLVPHASLENGMKILAYGRLTIYEPRGRYQFVVSLLHSAGLGSLQLAFERLKAKLKEEGLFEPIHKKPLPAFANRIGVITSPTGAAIRDIQSVLSRRWPLAEVYLFPSLVQGESAAEALIAAISRAHRFSQTQSPLDLLIVGRGGGSLEDLAAFNDEGVARAIFSSTIPIVSAVGHEIDFTIADFVADLRAPTPSAAAERVVSDRSEVTALLTAFRHRFVRRMNTLLSDRGKALRLTLRSTVFRLLERKVEGIGQRLDFHLSALLRLIKDSWKSRHRTAVRFEERIRLSDPYLPLQRGYSLTFQPGSKRPLRDAACLSCEEIIKTQLLKGIILSKVEEVKQSEDR